MTLIKTTAAVAIAGAAFLSTTAYAAIPVYPNSGTENAELYSFTAAADGDLVAYFTGSTGSFENVLGLIVNGTDLGLSTLNSHLSAPGDVFNFGPVSAGDALVFYINVEEGLYTWASDKSLNTDATNHIWSTAYGGGDFSIPEGIFVTFEDLPGTGTDFNYEDLGFVFTNVKTVIIPNGVPEPASWAMLIAGFGMIGSATRRRRNSLKITYA